MRKHKILYRALIVLMVAVVLLPLGEPMMVLKADAKVTQAQIDALKTIELPAEDIQLELETSVEGKPFILHLNADGTLRTGWTNYDVTMKDGTWAVVDGKLVLTMEYTSTITENAEGGLDIVINYSQMGEKTYTLSADQAKIVLK